MASQFVVHHAKHATLSTTTVDTVSFTMPGAKLVRVVNRNAASPLTFVVGRGTAAAGPDFPADPTVLQDESLVVPPGGLIDIDISHWDQGLSAPGRGYLIRNYRGGTGDPLVLKIVGSANEYSCYLFR